MTALAPAQRSDFGLFEIFSPIVRAFEAFASGSWKKMIQAAEPRSEAEPVFALDEQPGRYLLKALVPGASASTLHVDTTGAKLRIHGQSQVRFSDGKSFGYVRERPVDQTFALPPDADPEHVECSVQAGGVLVVAIPRHQCLAAEVVG